MEELLKQTQAYLNYLKEHYAAVKQAWARVQMRCSDFRFVKDDGAREAIGNAVYNHDMSKLSSEEFEPYRRKFFPTSIEAGILLKDVRQVWDDEFSAAWQHHQDHNSHHWQNWAKRNFTCDVSSELYCVHMVLDWVGRAIQRGRPYSQYYLANVGDIHIPEWAHTLVFEIFERLGDNGIVVLSSLELPELGTVSAWAVAKMMDSLRKVGQFEPVKVVYNSDTGFYIIIDGRVRVMAMNQLGWTRVAVNVVKED